MNKYLISIAMIILVFMMSGCASKSQAQVKFENEKLMHDLFALKQCRINSTENLDDGVSSVEIIAVAVIKDCSKDSKHVMDTNMYGKSDESVKLFKEQMDGVETSGVVGIILKNRSKK